MNARALVMNAVVGFCLLYPGLGLSAEENVRATTGKYYKVEYRGLLAPIADRLQRRLPGTKLKRLIIGHGSDAMTYGETDPKPLTQLLAPVIELADKRRNGAVQILGIADFRGEPEVYSGQQDEDGY